MTVSSELNRMPPYLGNGVTTTFAYSFPVLQNADLKVSLISSSGVETIKSFGSDYSLTGIGGDTGGNVVFTTAPASGYSVIIWRDMDITQPVDFKNQGEFSVRTHEQAFDRATMLIQQVQDNVDQFSFDLEASNADDYKAITLAVMKAITGMADGATCQTTGYYTAGDGGHGRYRFSATSVLMDNGVTIISPNIGGGRWVLMPFNNCIFDKQAGVKADGVTDDYQAMQNLLDSAAGYTVMLSPANHSVATGLVAQPNTTIIGWGATLTTASEIKMLSLGSASEVFGLSLVGPGAAYAASSFGIFATGIRGGAVVSPTFISDIKIIGCSIESIGNAAIELDYCKDSIVSNNTIRDIGYAGVFVYSGKNISVVNNKISSLTGESVSGQLNAYGVTFTSLSNTSDFVRDPVSIDCEASGNSIFNIPTWHALDTHGGKRILFKKNKIYNCRRGVILTNLVTVGAEDCVVSDNDLINELSGTNSNGSQKQGEAFWDVGQSSSVRNKRNKISNNRVFQHGDPVASVGALYIENAEDGIYEPNEFTEPYNYGVVIKSNVRRGSISRNTIIDPKGAGVGGGGPTDFPSYILFDGTNMDVMTVGYNNLLRKNSAVAAKVGEIGINVANTSLKSINFKVNTFDSVVLDLSLPELTGVTGDIEADFTGTLTGCTTSPTGTLQYTRNNNIITLRIPTITGTSNATTATITGVPINARPAAQQICYIRVTDNGVTQDGMALIGIDGTITLWVGAGLNAFTNAGTKGVADTTISYKVK